MKKEIGYIQLILGIILIISIYFTYTFHDNYWNDIHNRFQEYQNKLMEDPSYEPMSVNGQIQSIYGTNINFAFVTSTISIIGFEFIIFILSIILILQGLVNIKDGDIKFGK